MRMVGWLIHDEAGSAQKYLSSYIKTILGIRYLIGGEDTDSAIILSFFLENLQVNIDFTIVRVCEYTVHGSDICYSVSKTKKSIPKKET